jgi:hypothetical protein
MDRRNTARFRENSPLSFKPRSRRQSKQLPILDLRQRLLNPLPRQQLLEFPLSNPGENDGADQISPARLILPRPPRLLRPATGLGLLVLLLEPLKPLLEGDDLLIQLWQSDGSNRPPSGGKFAGGLGPISNIC